jgi:hypothetical protein
VDATTREDLAEIEQGADYDLSSMGDQLTIRVDSNVPISRVRFQWVDNGKLIVHREGQSPYVMAGEGSDNGFEPIPYLATEGIKMVAVDVYLDEKVVPQRKVLFFDMTGGEEIKPDQAEERKEMSLASLLNMFLDKVVSVFPILGGE